MEGSLISVTLSFPQSTRLQTKLMKYFKVRIATCLSVILFFGCDSIKTTEIKIEDEGLTVTAQVLHDSVSIQGTDTIRVLHGNFKLQSFSESGYFKSIETSFDKGFVNGKLKIEDPDGTYEGEYISINAKEYYDNQFLETKVRNKISRFLPSEFTQQFIEQNKSSNYILGQVGVPVGNHTIKKNDSIISDIGFSNGYPIGIWKKLSDKDTYDFMEFDSGKVIKEYTLQYKNGIIIKRIEDNREFIYENGVEVGTIVTIKFNCRNGGSKLFVPNGKMWTPLYYEISTKDYYYRIPQIYPKKAYNGRGWLKSNAYKFPEKENFTSYKISKQNNSAIYGNGEQAVLVDCYGDASYTAYFFEESN